jgi:hypothetical protein
MGGTCSADGEGRDVYRVLVGNLRERDHGRDRGVERRIILRWIFRRGMWVWAGLTWLRIEAGGGHL